jgi:hypothetical protein
MKRKALFQIFIFASMIGSSQSMAPKNPERDPYFQLIYHSGVYWSRTEYLADAFEDGFRAFEARLGFQSTGKETWQHIHFFPKYGFGLHYADLIADRGDTALGNPFSAFAFYSAPWARFGRFTLSTDLALGLSYTSVIHDPVLNPFNDVIASHLNLYFDFDVNLFMALTKRLDLSGGYGLTHYSNGRIHQPQKGVNNWGWNLGLSYHFSGQRPVLERKTAPGFVSKDQLQIMYGAGTVEHQRLGDPEGVRYFTSSFTVDYVVSFNHRMALAFGTDFLYDGSVARAIKGLPEEEVTPFQRTYLGSHLGYHYLIDRFTVLVNLGTYFWQHTRDRGMWFIRAGGRIQLTDHLFTQICIKTKNGVRADWIEWGMAYSFEIGRGDPGE